MTETVLLKANTTRRAFFPAYILIVGLLILSLYGWVLHKEIMSTFSFVFFLVAVIMVIIFEIKVKQTRFVLTDKRLIVHRGIIKKNIITLRYDSINKITLEQELWPRLLVYGTLTIHPSGGRQHDVVLENFGKPSLIKEIIEEHMIKT